MRHISAVLRLAAQGHSQREISISVGISRTSVRAAVAVYRQARAARDESTTPPGLWSAIMTDRRFRVPMMRLAERHAAHSPQTYAYLFTWRSPAAGGRLGAAHGFEVPFVFGTLDAPEAREFIPDGAHVGQLRSRCRMHSSRLREVAARGLRPPRLVTVHVEQRCTMVL